jgi:hypothetical protein
MLTTKNQNMLASLTLFFVWVSYLIVATAWLKVKIWQIHFFYRVNNLFTVEVQMCHV